jgi:hypothetical protein
MNEKDFEKGIRFYQADRTCRNYNIVQVVLKIDQGYVHTDIRPDGFGISSYYAEKCRIAKILSWRTLL